jgi:hypothetical protein
LREKGPDLLSLGRERIEVRVLFGSSKDSN